MRRIINNTEFIELFIKTNLYNENILNKAGKVIKKGKCIKRGILSRILVHPERDLYAPTELFDKKGSIIKREVKVGVRDIGPLIIQSSYDEIKNLIIGKQISNIGFKYKNKR